MTYQSKRTCYGKFMFNLTYNCSKVLMKHIWLYYILNYTWGLIMTIVGWIITIFIRPFLNKSNKGKFGPCLYMMIGNNWGGASIGTNIIIAKKMSNEWIIHTKCHEMGHTFQNALLGPFMIFLVVIPSIIRYHYQNSRNKRGLENKPYDLFWAEGSASTIGEAYYKNMRD